MKQREYMVFSGLIFTVVGFLHLLRVIYGWSLVVGQWEIPIWVSGAAVLILGFLAWKSYTLTK